jgi:hypothetical protein
MRDFLLSIASPEALSSIGFLIFALALLGEIGVALLPQKWIIRGILAVLLAGAVLVGHLINRIGDEARVTAAENELSALKAPKYPLTYEQRDSLKKVLEDVSPSERFEVTVLWPQINGTERYAKDIQQVFLSAKWDAKVSAAGSAFGHGISSSALQPACKSKRL